MAMAEQIMPLIPARIHGERRRITQHLPCAVYPRARIKSVLVDVLIRLPLELSGPIGLIIGKIWKGYRDA